MNTFMNNWLLRRAMSAPRKEEGPIIGYRTIGNPTITDGILSLPQNDCGIIPTKIFSPGSSPWEIRTRIKRTDASSWEGVVTSLDENLTTTRIYWVMFNGRLGVYVGNGSGWNIVGSNVFDMPFNTWYNLRFRFTGSAYYLDYSTDGINYTSVLVRESSFTVQDFYPLFGSATTAGNPLIGEWDLKSTAIYIDGQLWWKPYPYIQFADPAVEAICVANWSSDGIGLTMQDAAAVTSQQFRRKFAGNTQIVSFEEFQYFTGITKMPDSAFYQCSNLSSIILPNTLTDFATYSFGYTNIHSIVIPASLTNMSESNVFLGNSTLTVIFSGDVPPVFKNTAFNTVVVTAYVHYSADHSILAAYQTALAGQQSCTVYELNPDGTIPS